MLLKMSRNSRLCFAAVAVFVVATALVANTDAATYTVGGTAGWAIPSSAGVYDTFASQNAFKVGDVLVFNFATGQHDVAPVTKEAYDACNSTAAIDLLTVGPASVTLDFAGTHHFICTFGRHCGLGQKLAVNVTGSSSSPVPSPTPIAPIAPPTSSSAPPPTLLPPSGSASPPSEGPTPSGPASPPSEGPSPDGSAPGPLAEGPSPDGSAPGPSEGPGSSGSTTPAPGSEADGSSPPPGSSASKTGVATIFVGMFISAALGYML